MNHGLGILIFAIVSMQSMACAEFYNLPPITWHDCKHIVKENQHNIMKGLGIAFGSLLLIKFFYTQHHDIDTLCLILMKHNNEEVRLGLEDFLGNNWDISINTLGKIFICWKQPKDYGRPELYKLKALLWACKTKYDCIAEIETHDINLKLECILLTVQKKNE